VILDVGEMRLDVVEAVVAAVAVERDRTAMQPFAGDCREGQGMRQDKLAGLRARETLAADSLTR